MNLQDEVIKPNHNPILFVKDKFLRSKYQVYLRKVSLLLLSLSLLSLFLFFTGLSFLHSYTCYVSTFLLPFIAHTLERKYLFLLCNGILIFLARNSGLSGSLPSAVFQTEEMVETDDVLHQKKVNVVEEDIDMLQHASTAPVDPLYEADVEDEVLETQTEAKAYEDEEEDPVQQEVLNGVEADMAEDGGDMYNGEFEKENKKESGVIVKEEEDDGGSEGPASNTEELNKKIEEFIRKMKEELQLEAQQQQPIAA